jgi:sugar transferase (PEP-CTERM/EpsH1 system associated)
MIQHLGQNHSVVVASMAESEEEMRAGSSLADYCGQVIAELVPPSLRWSQALGALFLNKPSSVAYFWSPRLQRRILDVAQSVTFDLIMVHCAFVAHYVTNVPAKLKILDFGDLDSGKWFDYSRHRRFPLSIGYGLEAKKLRKFEKRFAQQFNYCTVTTSGELEEYERLNVGVPSTVIPNGVDFQNPSHRDNDKSRVIAFVGRMDYFPNIDGMLYFVREIFPRIRRIVPSAELKIIGSNPNASIRELSSIPGITVTGHVPEVGSFLQDAAVSVAPLRIARGTQNKILESMALGVPVVATPIAAKGVQAVPNKHLLVAEDPEEFARQVINIFENHALRRDLTESARRRIEKVHSWQGSMKVLDDILARLTQEPAPDLQPSYS